MDASNTHNPVSHSVSAADTYDIASPFRRLLGFAIDLAVAFSLLFLNGLLSYVAVYFHAVESLVFFKYVSYMLTLLAFGYILFCDALPNGQSLGKRVCRTAVVGFPYPTHCTLFQSLLRNLPKVLFCVLDGLFALFGLRRRLGDMLAKTIVINV